MADSRFVPVSEVAELLSVTPATVISWIKAGKLPAIKIGKDYRIEPAAVDSLIAESRVTS